MTSGDSSSSSSNLAHRHEGHHRIYVERGTFAVVWLALFLLRAAMATYCLALYKLYVFFCSDFYDYLAEFTNFPRHDLLVVSRCAAAAATLFLVPLAISILSSVRERQLSFSSSAIQAPSTKKGSEKRVWRALRRAYLAGERFVDMFGPEGAYFEDYTIMSELSEVVTETYQGYRVSYSVPDVAIANASAFFLVANCWSTPLVHWCLRDNPKYKRVAVVVLDALLDIGWSAVLPVAIFYPFYTMYDPATRTFNIIFSEADAETWYMEAPLLIVTKWLDLAAMLMPIVSIASSFSHIAALVGTKKAAVAPANGPNADVIPTAHAATPVHQPSKRNSKLVGAVGTKANSLSRTKRQHLLTKWSNRLFIGWGVVVLVAQVAAIAIAWKGAESGCTSFVRPWFSSKLACSITTVDCYRQDVAADAFETTFNSMVGGFDLSKLASLAIVNCGAIRMPSGFSQVRALTTLILYNISALDWPAELGVNETSTPVLMEICICSVGLTEVPPGLLQSLPPPLEMLHFLATNITDFPMELAELWTPLVYLDIESSKLQVVPPALSKLPLARLSVMFNAIEELPSDLLSDLSTLVTLAVANNPLTALPESSASFPSLSTVYFDNTLVATLPTWLTDSALLDQLDWAYATGSPYCSTADATKYPKIECSQPSIRPEGFGQMSYYTSTYGISS